MAFCTQRPVGFPALRAPTLQARRRSLIRAEDEKKTFFESNKLASTGYLEEDSAGQENIFAVQPRKYLQGSAVDETTGSAGNTFFGVAGTVLALAVLVSGGTALLVQSKNNSSKLDVDFSGLSTLSEYKAQFVQDLRPPQSAEAPAVTTEL